MTFAMKAAIVAAALVFLSGSTFAQQRNQPVEFPNPFKALFSGTPEEQAACRPDVAKYCKDAGDDELRVLSCLQQNRTRIGPPCRRVLESHGQ